LELTEVTVAARVSKEISDRINEISAEEKVGRSTIVRRFLDMGIRDWRVQTALDKYGQGSITLLKAAEIAGTNIYEMIGLLEERRIPYRYDISDSRGTCSVAMGKIVPDAHTHRLS
jgi:predicted HTH domain antitoxin